MGGGGAVTGGGGWLNEGWICPWPGPGGGTDIPPNGIFNMKLQ